MKKLSIAALCIIGLAGGLVASMIYADSSSAQRRSTLNKNAWPNTDFSRKSIDLDEIMSGGPPKDGIPSIDDPKFVKVGEVKNLTATAPVISININGDARAYPVSILMFHEIVNDTVGDVPVSITYCPLCNASIVYDRRVGGKVLDFGTTGKLRNSDMVMYDRQTESWWQQFMGEAIVGELLGTRLKRLPARIESFMRFKAREPFGKVLVSSNVMRSYGTNPYVGYDSSEWPFLFRGKYDEKIPPLAYVVMVGEEAWSLEFVRKKGTIKADDLVITWKEGQNSALDSRDISRGKDIGNVIVQRKAGGKLTDVIYSIPFAFAFKVFHPDGVIHVE